MEKKITKEQRKVVYQSGNYQLLKPKDDGNNGSWYNYGRITSLKAISDLISNGRYVFEINPDVQMDLDRYNMNKRIRINRYLSKKKNLESKTI